MFSLFVTFRFCSTFWKKKSIKFCVKLGKNGVKTLKMLKKAYGDNALSHTTVFEWHKRFKKGRESTDDNHHPGVHQRAETIQWLS
jgi:hypothetical protein